MICIHLLRNSDFVQRMQPRFSWDKHVFKISITSWTHTHTHTHTYILLIVQADSLPSEPPGKPSDKTFIFQELNI